MRIPTPFIIFSVLFVLSCVIAYVSDNMGKKLGKKRISLLGMRPRQTATALTMASSVGIMLVTFFVLMLFSKQVRDAILSGERLKEGNRQLRSKNHELREEATSLNARLSELQKSVSENKQSATQANKKMKAANKKLTSTNKKLTSAQARLKGAQTKLVTAQRGEKKALRQAKAAQDRFTAANRRAAAARKRVASVQARLAQANRRLKNVNLRFDKEVAKLARIRSNLTRVRQALLTTQQKALASFQQVATSKIEQERLQKAVDELRASEQEQQKVVKTLEMRRLQAEQELIAVDQELQTAGRALSGDVAVAVGQIFAAATFPANSSVESAAAALRALLARGNQVVVKRGLRSLHLAPLRIQRGGQGIELDEDGILAGLATYLSSFDTPASVRLSAARDHASGEVDIVGRMLVVPVKRIFARDETIVAASVDGTQSDARLFNQLLKMVNGGERLARQRGAAPLLTEEDPNFYAGGTNERIFEAMRQIQSRKGSVGVRLTAADDLNTIEPLRVRFEVDSS